MAKSKKGSAFERKFCKDLSLWWTFGVEDDVFWRTSGSGARATTRMKQGKKTADSYGDVGSIDTKGKPLTTTTLIELKRGYTGKKGKKGTRWISILDLIDIQDWHKLKTKPVLIEWWIEAEKQKEQAGRQRSFIVFRRDRRQGCIVMGSRVFKWLTERRSAGKGRHCRISILGYDLVVVNLEDFFEWVDPRRLGAKRIITRRK